MDNRSTRRLVQIAMTVFVAVAFSLVCTAEVHQDGQFSVAVPDGWQILEYAAQGERILVASPAELTQEQTRSVDGFDADVTLMVNVGAIPIWLRSDPLRAAYTMLRDAQRDMAQQAGAAFSVVQPPQATRHHGHDALTFVHKIDNTISKTLLTQRAEYLYRLEFWWDEDSSASYEQLLEGIIQSFQPKDPPPVRALIPKKTRLATLDLPAPWHVSEFGTQALVSREKLAAPVDQFQVGVTLMSYTRYSDVFRIPSASPLVMYQFWVDAWFHTLEQIDPTGFPLDVRVVTVDGTDSILIESVSDDGAGTSIRTLVIGTVRGDDFMVAIFEAPVDEYYIYGPIFMKSIAGLRWGSH